MGSWWSLEEITEQTEETPIIKKKTPVLTSAEIFEFSILDELKSNKHFKELGRICEEKED